MDELLDVLDTDGNFTGKTAMKSVAHKNGLFHPTVHVWVYTQSGQILIQQRGREKDTHPLYWDVSVAGHIGAGEDFETSAIREVLEEIGLEITRAELHKMGVFKSVHYHHDNLIDCEYHHSYICELKVPFERLTKQDSEVEALHLIPLSQFSEEISHKNTLKKYVPYKEDYYQLVVKLIQEKL